MDAFGEGLRGKKFLSRLPTRLSQGKRLSLPTDQLGTPTYVIGPADAVVELATTGGSGVFHVAGPNLMSRYGLARSAAEVFEMHEGLITPVLSSSLTQPAIRPPRLKLTSDQAEQRKVTRLLGFREALSVIVLSTTGLRSTLRGDDGVRREPGRGR